MAHYSCDVSKLVLNVLECVYLSVTLYRLQQMVQFGLYIIYGNIFSFFPLILVNFGTQQCAIILLHFSIRLHNFRHQYLKNAFPPL